MAPRTVLVTLLFLFASLDAHSQIWQGPLGIDLSPSAPRANSLVDAILPINGCYHGGPNYDPARTNVVLERRAITVDLYVRQLIYCFSAGDPLVPWAVSIRLPMLHAGIYTINARYFAIDNPGAAPFQELSRSFVVASGAAIPLPLDNRESMLALCAILLALGARSLAIRQRA